MARSSTLNKRKVARTLPRLEAVEEETEDEDQPSSSKKAETAHVKRINGVLKTTVNTAVSQKSLLTRYIQNRILNLMPDCKRTAKHPKIMKKLNEVYYKERGSLESASTFQKAFASILLRLMIVPFKSDRSTPSERYIKLFTEVILNFGLEDDKLEAAFTLETGPLFFEILKYLMKEYVLFEDRQSVRLRVVELMEKILTTHNSHPLLCDASFRDKIRDVMCTRIRDKYFLVRAKAALALRFFLDNKDTRKGVKYAALYDPNPEVRRYCIMALKDCDNISTDFFCEKSFDRSPVVAMESLKVICSRPITLHPSKMQKLLHWGLKHYNEPLKKQILEELIPVWLEKSNGVVNFLQRLDLSFKPKTTSCILDGIIRENTEEYFENIDRSFLNEQKLIPINEVSLEKMIYWLFLCSKFKDKNYCLDKLLPTPADVIKYLECIIEKIHFENEQAELEDREEDVTYLLCLSHAIRITAMCSFEESTRRDLEGLLINILVDQILDEAPLLVVVTDTLHKIVEPIRFQEIITTVIQEIFDPSQINNNCSTSRRRNNSLNVTHQTDKSVADGGEESLDEDSPNFTPYDASTPLVTSSRQSVRNTEGLSDGQKCELKAKLAGLGFDRNKLIGKRDEAKESNDFLEAGRLQKEIVEMEKRENNLRVLLGLEESEKPVSKERESLSAHKIAKELARTHDSYLKHPSLGQDQSDVIASQPINSQSPKISDSGLLRGIVIGTRFLICQKAVIPCIRQFIDNEISRPLLSEDSRVRIHTLQLLCMFALYDKREARKVMTAQLRALTMDTPDVQIVAYKCVVDLLLNYKYEEFKFQDGDVSWPDLPNCLNDCNATKEDLENHFVMVLDTFARDNVNDSPGHIEHKTEGMLKLLLRGCVTINSESLIARLLYMWVDPVHAGTSICSGITSWLPRYSHISVVNAKRVGKGLMLSLERVLNDEVDSQAEEDRNANVDNAMKLFELVLPSISSQSIQRSVEGKKIQAYLAIDMMKLILKNVQWEYTGVLGRMLNRLEITDAIQAMTIVKLIGKLIVVSMGFPKTVSISRTKCHVNRLHKRLSKNFANLPTLDELRNDSDSDSEPESPEREINPVFSDSSQSDIFANNSGAEGSPRKSSSRSSGEREVSNVNIDLHVSPAKSDSPEMESRLRSRRERTENNCDSRRETSNVSNTIKYQSRKRSNALDNKHGNCVDDTVGPNFLKRRKLSRYESSGSLNTKTQAVEIERRQTRSMSVS